MQFADIVMSYCKVESTENTIIDIKTISNTLLLLFGFSLQNLKCYFIFPAGMTVKISMSSAMFGPRIIQKVVPTTNMLHLSSCQRLV